MTGLNPIGCGHELRRGRKEGVNLSRSVAYPRTWPTVGGRDFWPPRFIRSRSALSPYHQVIQLGSFGGTYFRCVKRAKEAVGWYSMIEVNEVEGGGGSAPFHEPGVESIEGWRQRPRGCVMCHGW